MSAGLSSSVPHLTREKDEEDGVEGGGWGGFGECDPRGDAEWYAEDDADVAACLFPLYQDRKQGREAQSLLKMDLHYSHKVDPVKPTAESRLYKETLNKHNIIPLFVPGACTDEVQECDTVLNKPFKGGVKDGFRNYLHGQYDEWKAAGKDPNAWTPLFGMEQLKPRVTSWVEEGLKRIRTPAMKTALIDAFKRDGRFAEIRSAVCQAAAASDLEKAKSVIALEKLFQQEMTEEEEEDVQELDAGDDEGLELVCEDFAAVVV